MAETITWYNQCCCEGDVPPGPVELCLQCLLGEAPDEYSVVISGMWDAFECDCSLLDGTYIVSRVLHTFSNVCKWVYTPPSPICNVKFFVLNIFTSVYGWHSGYWMTFEMIGSNETCNDSVLYRWKEPQHDTTGFPQQIPCEDLNDFVLRRYSSGVQDCQYFASPRPYQCFNGGVEARVSAI